MAGRLLCQKLPSSGPRPAAPKARSLFDTARNTCAAAASTIFSRTNNNKLEVAKFVTTQAAAGDVSSQSGKNQAPEDSVNRGGAGDSKGGALEVARRRDAQAPARRSRPRDFLLTLAPSGIFDLWDPLTTTSRSLRQMIDTMDRLFDESLLIPSTGIDKVLRTVTRTPWDVAETDGAYLLRVDMPGISKDEVKICVEDYELVICAEHKAGDEGSENEARSYAVYHTRVILPEDANVEEIKAELKNGVLNVVVSKQVDEKKERKEIPVS